MVEEYINEYTFSGGLRGNASTYVTREADNELFDALQKGKFCYVLSSRQSGKSSLRVRTMSRLSEAGVECASIDLSVIDIQSATQEKWYADLIVKLIDSFDLDVNFKEWWSENQLNSSLLRFGNFLEKKLLAEIKENIVIFIDEIDSVLSLKFPTDDFFAFIRACHNLRPDNPEYNRLSFCLLGVASPSNLIEDKQRTPFNIGKAISLSGFRLHEVEPLEKGLQGKFSQPQAVMKEILYWTGGQPFLTQKLCQFMVEESVQDNPRSVEQVVKSRIIENWESQDEPEHLRTIRARILRDEQRAGYLLELYQQVRLTEEESQISADDTLEQSELQLSGLVVRQHNKLRVYNPIYQEIFDANWIENQLKNLRPYSESFRFWLASGGKDESRLLRGKALQDALEWSKDKSLNYQDTEFLAASQAKERKEEITALEKEAALERERKDREAVEKRNLVLSEANQQAKKRIHNGTFVLILTVLGAVISVTMAVKEVKEAQKKLQETYTYVAYPKQLIELKEKLSRSGKDFSEEPIEINIEKVKDSQLEQVYLHASKSLAYQYLDDWKSAEESIKQSMNFLKGWDYNNEKREKRESNSEFKQINIFAKIVQGNLLRKTNQTQSAIKAYQEVFDLLELKKSQPNPINSKTKIITFNTIKSVHFELIDLLTKYRFPQNNDLLSKVRESLKNYYDAELDNLLKNNKWEAADKLTYKLMLYIAQREEETHFDYDSINSFSCPDLQTIDRLWVTNSHKRFGFSVQKKIWKMTGNSSIQFAKAVGWYNDVKTYSVLNELIRKNPDLIGSYPVFFGSVRGFNSTDWFGNVVKGAESGTGPGLLGSVFAEEGVLIGDKFEFYKKENRGQLGPLLFSRCDSFLLALRLEL
ncbi:AAA-like domain-containing protein [Brasilonema sp. UFV-L1]|uniref:AAA-like domain-containing protein n=1 Tax=Brasilonema sp. UFV-L1 TaxID=2234130 RepID=UPI00145CD351|nr:AAA-like domain-containing protein [Brasilonema sp. UFV-L1]NMG07157.1 hypothetical protein [Brasilonema sp. UFV-L1]